MRNDEQSIRDLFSAWHAATVSGNASKLLDLMHEDVVFLQPSQPPMRGREEFAKAFRRVLKEHRIDYKWETEEIQVDGDLAHCVNHFWVTIFPVNDGPAAAHRSGFALTILRRNASGDWVIYRDANMLTDEQH